MFTSVLIANRGEIACRIIRTARRLGIATVAVYSDADQDALHVSQAGAAVHIGPAPASESYLRGDRIIAAAQSAGADCIHPGYGFLAENAGFAEACRTAGITFVGPSPEAMRRLGDKAQAKALARGLGIPVVPGYDGAAQDATRLAAEARRIGYPVLIKAAAGGGGRGMRLVERAEDFAAALDSAVREATAAFGDGRVLLERLIVRPRHIEVQIFADAHGNVVHLFERDCSLQRRNQKVIEEAPAPGMTSELRALMTGAAVRLARSAHYEGAGTVEFLVEGGTLDAGADWYFIEMNTRLQVEHPVTEEITGLDLVAWQLRAAAGERLPRKQDEIRVSGHAIEARINAEDPANDFLPSTGRIVAFEVPTADGVRVETGVRTGDEVSPYYDSMIAKLIAHGADRERARSRLKGALEQSVLAGPRTNAAFLNNLLAHPDVVRGNADTSLIGRELGRLTPKASRKAAVEFGAPALLEQRADDAEFPIVEDRSDLDSPWRARDAFQLGPARGQRVTILVDGAPTVIEARWMDGSPQVRWLEPDTAPEAQPSHIRTESDSHRILVLADLAQTELAWPDYGAATGDDAQGSGVVRAPINGRVAKVFVTAGEAVEKGARVAVIEAMKMEQIGRAHV